MKSSLRESVLSNSPIWNEDIIETLNKKKISTFEMNKLRSKYLTPVSQLDLGENESRIPVLVIQNSSQYNFRGLRNGKLFSGWDVVVPHMWAMPFWMTLVHFGAKAVGLKEMKYAHFESGND
jgi:hypothetical protein